MRIAMIGHKRVPGREGGIEVVVEELATRMVERNHKVTLYNRKKSKAKKYKKYKGINIKTIPTIETKKTDAIIYSFLASICVLFQKNDIIHYHGIGPSLMLLIPHIFRKKIVVTVHGLNYKTPKWNGLGAKVMKLGEKITAKYADAIIVLSQEQKKYFREKYNRDTIYIPNGVTMAERNEANEIKRRWGLDKNEYILFLSRVVPGKGLEYLIDAYKEIKTDKKLIIAGGTEYVSDFFNEICEKIKDDSRIKMIGFVEGQALNELYSNAFVYVFPSEAEGMPMCLLEALSLNCKCIVSDIPENKEVGKDYVKIFKSMDKEDLKNKIEECIKNNAQNFKEGSRDYIRKTYNWEIITTKTLELYEKIIRGRE